MWLWSPQYGNRCFPVDDDSYYVRCVADKSFMLKVASAVQGQEEPIERLFTVEYGETQLKYIRFPILENQDDGSLFLDVANSSVCMEEKEEAYEDVLCKIDAVNAITELSQSSQHSQAPSPEIEFCGEEIDVVGAVQFTSSKKRRCEAIEDAPKRLRGNQCDELSLIHI